MKKINIYLKSGVWGLILAFIIASCSDDIDYVTPYPNINVQFDGIKSTYYFNEIIELNPIITYGSESNNYDDFSYRWSVREGENLRLISEERNINYALDKLGELWLYLEIKNKTTEVVETFITTVEVESSSNHAWYVLKTKTDGNAELDGFYFSTDNPNYNMIEQFTGSPLEGDAKVLAFSTGYPVMDSDSTSWSYGQLINVNTLMVFSANDGLAFNVSEGTLAAKLDDMFFMNPKQTDHSITGGLVSESKVFISMDNASYNMNYGNPAFFPEIEGDYSLSTYMTEGSYGNTLAFDDKNKRFVMFESGNTPSANIRFFKDEYSEFNNGVEVPVNNMNGQVIFLENTQSGSGWEATTYAYSLFKKDGKDDELTLYGLDYEKLAKGSYWHYPIPGDWSTYTVVESGDYSPINYQKTLTNSEYTMLTSADVYAMHKHNDILYFAKGNKVGLYNIDSQTYDENFITGIPSGEQITFMKYINCKYEGAYFDFSGLVVATYIESSDTYKIYRYQLDGLNSVTLQDDIKTGQGKVSKVMYVAGSSWEWASDLSLYN